MRASLDEVSPTGGAVCTRRVPSIEGATLWIGSGAAGVGGGAFDEKFAGESPVLFKRLIDEFGIVSEAVSKYRLALPALGIVRLPEPAASGTVMVE